MSDSIRMQIITYCESIRTGSKPVAMISIQTRYLDKIKEIVELEGLKLYLEDAKHQNDWKVAWIYKDEYLLEVIKKAPECPNSIYEHWVLGKLFGYSDEAIKDFLATLYDM